MQNHHYYKSLIHSVCIHLLVCSFECIKVKYCLPVGTVTVYGVVSHMVSHTLRPLLICYASPSEF
jgi:hypothetical protein